MGRSSSGSGDDRFISVWDADTFEPVARLAGQLESAISLLRETREHEKTAFGPKHPATLRCIDNLARAYQVAKAWDDAEPLIREELAIREASAPNDWQTFNTKSMLGEALFGQTKLAEAEPLLLEGYRGMKEREAAIPRQGKARIPEALERLVQFYEATRNQAEAAAWRSKLDAARAEQTKATTKGAGNH